MKKRIVSLLMAALMTVSLLPTAAWAEVLEPEASEASQTPAVSDAQSYTEDSPVVCSDTDVDTALKNAGFTTPELMGTNPGVGVSVPCWSDYTDLCSLDWNSSTGEMTLNMYAASSEAWNAAYEQSVSWFGNDTKVMCVVPYYAPDNAYYYSACMGGAADALDFANNYSGQMYGNGGNPVYDCNWGTAIASVSNGCITNVEDYTTYYMIVWYDANDEVIAQYALKINVQSEPFLYSTTDTSTTDALRDAGYNVPTTSQFYIDMPDGLVEGTDYTISYDQTTGHATVKLLPGNETHWQQAFEDEVPEIVAGFEKPQSTATRLNVYFGDRDDSVVNRYIGGTYGDYYEWYTGDNLRPGSGRTFASVSEDADSNVTISVPQGSSWVRCIAVWADSNGNVLDKFMYTLSIEADADFSYTWNAPLSLEEQLRDKGFEYPTMGDMETNRQYGYFYLDVPKGLVEDTNYTYTYDQTTGTLTINLLKGEYDHWKAAYLNKVISEPETAYIDFGVNFSPARANVDNVAGDVGREAIQALLRGEYSGERFYFEDLNYGYCGNGFTGVWLDSSDSAITIRAEQGTEELLYAVVWEDHDTHAVVAKYMLKVVINVEEGFSYTIKTPQVRDITADRVTVDDTNIKGGKTAWNIVNKNGQLAFMPASGQTLAGIMNGEKYITSFTIEAPDGYTLQSYYVRQFRDGSNMEEKAPTDLTFDVDIHDNLLGSDTGTRGGTLRYTLRWSSNNPDLPDLVEKLNVRIGDYALGKTTVTGNAEMDSEPNILDVQNMYDHMTTSQTASGDGNDTDQVDPELATYDINFDGSADIYDLQGLYETVAQDKPLQ